MKIGGIIPFSLCEFPRHVAAVVFTQGCNFRCPFCHNGGLIPHKVPAAKLIPESEVFDYLGSRGGQLEGVGVTGGEPTLQDDLADFMRRVKELGFMTKLDTNGSRPDVLRILLNQNLVDFIAMDIKAPLPSYDRLAGLRVDVERIGESVAVVASSGVPHLFRTTVVGRLLSDNDLEAIRALVPEGSTHQFQPFDARHAFAPALRK